MSAKIHKKQEVGKSKQLGKGKMNREFRFSEKAVETILKIRRIVPEQHMHKAKVCPTGFRGDFATLFLLNC